MKFFDEHWEDDFGRVIVRRHETQEEGHGCEEPRHYFICPAPEDRPDRSRWAGLKAIGIVITSSQRGGKDCGEVRYCILRKYLAATRIADSVPGHGTIESNLHRQLDATPGDDPSRLRQGHVDINFSILRRGALSLQ